MPQSNNPQPTNTSVKPKLRMPHPAAAAAAQFRQDTAHLRAGEGPASADPTPAPTTQPQVVPPTIPPVVPETPAPQAPAAPLTPIQDIPLPDGYVDVLRVPETPVPQAQPPVPGPAHQQFQQDNKELLEQLNEIKQQLEAERARTSELQLIKEEREFDEMLKQSGVEFSSIDHEDAKKLMAPVLSAIRQQQTSQAEQWERRLAEQEAAVNARIGQLTAHEVHQRADSTRAAILAAHPDLETLQNSPEYHRLMLSPVSAGSGLLVGQLVAAEFQKGNSSYIIQLLDQVKGKQPTLENVASVGTASAGVGHSNGDVANDGVLSYEQIAQMKLDVQQGNMSRDEFRTAMNKHREAKRKPSANQ